MTKKIVASLFESADRAKAVARSLEAAGVPREAISLFSDIGPEHAAGGTGPDYAAPVLPGAPVLPVVPVAGAAGPILGVPGADMRTGSASSEADRTVASGVGRLADWLADEGIDEDDARAYADGVRRGGALLAVRCDDSDVDRVVRIVDGDDAPDLRRSTAAEAPAAAGRETGREAPDQPLGGGRVRIHGHRA